MKVTAERLPPSQVVLEIEVDADRVERSMEWAYRRLADRTKVPGFRKGKAPRPMLERYVGRDALMREALDHLVPEVYREAVEQESIDPIDRPDFEVTSLEPVVLKATVPIRPKVELGDYTSIRLDPPDVAVERDEVEAVLQDLRRRYATLEPRDRPVQDGDTVRCDVRAWVDDRQILNEQDAQFMVRTGGTVSLPGFSDALLGLEKGRTHTFNIGVPDDFEERSVAGKTARYEVDVKEVKEELLPALDDGFAKTVGEGFDSFDELRARLEADILASKQRHADDQYQSEALRLVAERAEVEFPPVLLEREIDRLLHERSGHANDRQAFEQYLRGIGRSEDEIREDLRPTATESLVRSLVLTELSATEAIEVIDADIEAEIDALAGTGPQAERVRQAFAAESGRDVIRRSLVSRRTLERLAAIARGADGAVPEAAPAAARTRGSRGKPSGAAARTGGSRRKAEQGKAGPPAETEGAPAAHVSDEAASR